MWKIKKVTARILLCVFLVVITTGCGGGNTAGNAAGNAVTGTEAGEVKGTQTETDSGEANTDISGTAEADLEESEGAGETGEKENEEAADREAAAGIEIPEKAYFREDGGVSIDVFAMDTYMTLLAYGDRAEDAVLAAAKEIHSLDDRLSTGKADSEVSVLNAAGGGTASELVQYLVRQSLKLYKETGGLFDIAIYPVMKLWGFPDQEYRVPEKSQIEEALKLTDASAISFVKKAAEGSSAEGTSAKGGQEASDQSGAGDTSGEAAAEKGVRETSDQSGAGDTSGEAAAEKGGQETADQSAAGDSSETGMPEEDGAEQARLEEVLFEAAFAEEDASGADISKAASSKAASSKAASSKAASSKAASSKAASEPEEVELRFGIPGMEIDLGGIAKGYTGNRVMEIFRQYGISHGLISLGGNVQALGAKNDEGKAWRIAVQNPKGGEDYLGVLDIKDRAVITSGGYERYFEQDGIRYHHIIDPRTGYPADSGMISVTIISEDGTLADGLSTSLFIMGKEKAEKLWRAHADRFDYILEDAGGTLYVTEGVKDLLTTSHRTVVITR